MKADIKLWQFIGFVISAFLGTIFHFLYTWTYVDFFALFSSVNESTAEHMKLVFFPMLIFAIIEYFILGKQYQNYWCIKLKGILIALMLIPVFFYTLNGIFGKTAGWVNVLTFFIALFIAYFYETKRFINEKSKCKFNKCAIVVLIIIATLFIIFTFAPPKIPLFLDPLTYTYGI